MLGETTPGTRLIFKWSKYKLQFYHLWLGGKILLANMVLANKIIFSLF